jgi:hypothetical protein
MIISFVAKDNVHGLGYSGLDPRSALPGSHINLFEPPAITKTGRKGIRGQVCNDRVSKTMYIIFSNK